MARQLNALGPISGRMGDKIYVVRNDVSFVRSLPRKSTKAPTEKQLIQRARFTLVIGFLFPILSIINEAYRKINPKKTGAKMAAEQIFREGIIGEYPAFEIDYSKVLLLRGGLNPLSATMNYVVGSNELDFIWYGSNFDGSSDDRLLPFIYCKDLNEFWYDRNCPIRRRDEFCILQVPEYFKGYEIHVWLAYRSADDRQYSDSSYIGGVQTLK